ncbi:hypothetical protein G7Y89_g2359 [Cudoniella acicularis]|uniref:Uncharacterized protein n=1 Tax=Cudoniella acicularis TaxID=354080 RepID=A0A8H4W726_9HELO|nr:hypothetical protein G7Y89_g2359 [Cudoniella acicularis]
MYLSGAELKRQDGTTATGGDSTTAASTTATGTASSFQTSLGSMTGSPTLSATPGATPHSSISVLPDSGPGAKAPNLAIIIGVIAGILGFLLAFFFIRQARIKHKNPKYIPTPFLKKAWEKWTPGSSHQRLSDSRDHLEPITSRDTRSSRSMQTPASFDAAAPGAAGTGNNAGARGSTVSTGTAGVDRNTSVRSVMTLPAYNPNPLQNEQVLGREGDRGGIDVVIEYPETVDEEELRREEEMEALYQVRLARRRENEERDERRRLRREARERGDYVALREIQARARAASGASASRTVEELRAEHQRIKEERQRAVSSVSYADLGVARHDGTRIRANSVESEREGLLGDAASMAASSHYHRRDRSASSILSLDTMNSDFPSPGLTRSRANSRTDSPHGRNQDNSERAGSSPEIIDHDDIPPNSPPGYENIPLENTQSETINEPPPDYSSPIIARGEGPSFESPTSPNNGHGRKPSATHIGQLISERRTSSSSSTPLSATNPYLGDRRASRGVGGIPQLPSLRLANLPSIQVDPGSPIVRTIDEEAHHPQ